MKELKQQKEKKKAPKKKEKEVKSSEPKKKESSSKENSSKVIPCDCIHEAQDQLYGRGRRLCRRLGGAKSKSAGYRCTVCDRIHT